MYDDDFRVGNGRWIGSYAKSYEPKWLAESLVLKNGLNILLGAPKARKSTFRRALAAAILAGKPFLGFQTRPVEKALVLVGESAPELEGALQHQACDAVGLTSYEKRLYLEKPLGFCLTDPKDLQELIDFVKGKGFGLLCIDPLVNFHTANENDAKEMGAVARALLTLAELTSLFVVHHTAKPSENDGAKTVGQRGRGSSALAGASDTNLLLARRGQSESATLSFETRHAEEPEPVQLSFANGTWAVEARLSDEELKALVYKLAQEKPTLSANDIVGRVRRSRNQVLKLVKEARSGTDGTSA